MKRIRIVFAIMLICLIINAIAVCQTKSWTENSFEDFIDGAFMDAGNNLYISASGCLQMISNRCRQLRAHPPLIGATQVVS